MLAVIKVEIRLTGSGIRMAQNVARIDDDSTIDGTLPEAVAAAAHHVIKRGAWTTVDTEQGKYIIVRE